MEVPEPGLPLLEVERPLEAETRVSEATDFPHEGQLSDQHLLQGHLLPLLEEEPFWEDPSNPLIPPGNPLGNPPS